MFQFGGHSWVYSLSNVFAETLLVAKIRPPKCPVTASPFRAFCKSALPEIAFHKHVHWGCQPLVYIWIFTATTANLYLMSTLFFIVNDAHRFTVECNQNIKVH